MTCFPEPDHMVSSAKAEPCGVTMITESVDFSAEPWIFLEGHPTHAIRMDFDSLASAIEFYIILHKILTETVY